MVNLNKKLIGGQYTSSYRLQILFLLIPCSMLLVFCTQKKKKSIPAADISSLPAQPGHYDFSHPQGITLGDALHEVSGIAYITSRTMLAENDEQGRIFSIPLDLPNNQSYASVRFGKKADYEDIVVVDSTAYLLISNGGIVEVDNFAKGPDVPSEIIGQIAGKKNEFESMYYDKSVNSLIVLCKSCHHENDEIRTAYRFDLTERKFSDSVFYSISLADIAAKLNDQNIKFHPSAAALHPILNKIYIISSIGKLMVITDTRGKVEEVMRMNENAFNQPEGLTFAPNGDMYISNEGGTGEATLLKFTYKP